jgi:crotonobetainyl-CoA:carnitine CoA-transferase CaiB-like acyl-CoA transferase
LSAVGVPGGPINTVADVFADPQVIARGMLLSLTDGIPGIASPIVMDGERLVSDRASPRLA